MNRKGVDMEQVYDQQGVRVIVPEIGDCYAALGSYTPLAPDQGRVR